MPDTIVIADDVTGANDIGIMYTKAGQSSVVYNQEKLQSGLDYQEEIVIIDTNSRFLNKEEAYQRVYNTVKHFDKHRIHQFYNKQCSVFRGNIGAEFDAMLDALEEEFAVVVLGFPDNGRTTLHSVHYVHGVKLENSQFRDDPVHPMTQSDLVDILQAQTKRKVTAIHFEVLDQGAKYLKEQIDNCRINSGYVILDVRNNEDLTIIAEAVMDEKIICGSSALAYYLGLRNDKTSISEKPSGDENKDVNPNILCIAGSLTPQTKAQVQYMRDNRYPVITLNTLCLFTEEECKDERKRIIQAYEKVHTTSGIVIIHSMNDPEEVKRTKELATEHQMDNTAASELVSSQLSDIAKQIGEKYKIKKYIICGGDTSASFCNKLGIIGMKIRKEIEPGLPTCKSITEPYYQLVLKSGSFGSKEFIETAGSVLLED
jgi:uncharacterized protein YgbK (DUF1537 family)